jgi:hypothetical protein
MSEQECLFLSALETAIELASTQEEYDELIRLKEIIVDK